MRHDVDLPEIEIEGEKFPDYPGMAVWYADKIVSGKVPAGKWIKLGAKRFLTMLEKAESGKFKGDETPYTWSPDDVVDVCSFEENLRHVHGFHGTLVLDPWQMFGNAIIWGFRLENGARLTRLAYEWVPRGGGKSFRSATRGLFAMTCEGEVGPLGYICGAKDDDAMKVYGPMKGIVDTHPELAEHFEIEALKNVIRFGQSGELERVTEVLNPDEGHNPHLVVMEELHKQKGGLYRVMRSSLGKRDNSLFLSISTAGRLASGVGWDNWKFCQRILEGAIRADHVSVLMFAADEDDEEQYDTLPVLQKAIPHLGTSVRTREIMNEAIEARGKPHERAEFLRTRLNIWSRAAGNLIDGERWDKGYDPELKIEQFGKNDAAWIGCDLASRNDLAAVTVEFERGNEVCTFAKYYIVEDAPIFELEEYAEMYLRWREEGWLTVFDGAYMDFRTIQKDIETWSDMFDTRAVVLDDYQANQVTTDLIDRGYPAQVFKKNAKNTTEPTDELLALISAGLLRHDGNPITRWCALNTVGWRDALDQILPKKDKSAPNEKIDGFDSLLMANAARITNADERPKESIYEKRGPRRAAN